MQQEYELVQNDCRQFACELLDLCRDAEELEIFLNVGDDEKDDNGLAKNIEMRRVYLAVTYGQKEVCLCRKVI